MAEIQTHALHCPQRMIGADGECECNPLIQRLAAEHPEAVDRGPASMLQRAVEKARGGPAPAMLRGF